MALTYIWVSFFVLSFIVGLFNLFAGNSEILNKIVQSTFTNSKTAFEIALYLTGSLAFWCGLMSIAERSGLVQILARVLSPVFSRMFPDIPRNHPAMGSMFMNFSANMLGLDNAATPLGLKAMQELQSVNPQTKDTASDAQIMFLVLNTSGLTIIPISIMAFRAQAGATNPSDIFLPTFIATILSSFGGFLFTSLFQKVIFDRLLVFFLSAFLIITMTFLYILSSISASNIQNFSSIFSNVFLFGTIVCFLVFGLIKKINVYETFIDGAKNGFTTSVTIIPHLVGMLVGIGVLRESGVITLSLDGLSFMLNLVGIDGRYVDSLPVAFMRPLSGSGARALMLENFQTFGVDSFVGRLSSIIQGSSDTTLYVLAVYFGSVNIKKTRHALGCGIVSDFIGLISAILVCYLFFG